MTTMVGEATGGLDPFLELVYSDPDLLRAEFDELMAQAWVRAPARPAEPNPSAPAHLSPRLGRPGTRCRRPWHRPRSPPQTRGGGPGMTSQSYPSLEEVCVMGLSLDSEDLRTSTAGDLEAALAENEQLRAALASRSQIGIAQGMLMLRYGLTRDRAFQYLARRSQASNIKLREVALDVARELNESCAEDDVRADPIA